MKNILLTGSSGFIGRHLKDGLSEEFTVFAPTSKELDVSELMELERYILTNSIEIIIHAATYNKREISQEIELYKNLKMTCNIEKVAGHLEKVLYFGSGAEYDKRYPIDMATENDIGHHIPDYAYGFSKYIANSIARGSRNIYNLRLLGVFGSYEDWESCFISNLCCKAVFNLPLSIRQNCAFDYMYIDDLVQLVRKFLTVTPRYHDYNVVTGVPILLTEIAQKILTVSKKNLPINILKQGFNLPYTANNQRLTAEIDFNCTSIDISIEKLYNWYGKNRDIIDLEILRNTK